LTHRPLVTVVMAAFEAATHIGAALASLSRQTMDISPCNYWPYGAHPYFRERRASIAQEAGRWFKRLRTAAARTGRVSTEALSAYLDELASLIADHLSVSGELSRKDAPYCPVAYPRACVAEGRSPLAAGSRSGRCG